MRKFLKAAALAATALTAALPAATPVFAQTAQAQIVIVDMDDVIGNSSAGKSAQAVLQGQANSLQARVKTLADGFQKEEDALRTGFQNKTLTQQAAEAKAKDIESRKQSAQTEIAGRQRTLQASQAYVIKQIDETAQPIITAIMREKGASIALARGATIQAANSLDITDEVIRRVNAAKPRVSTTPPAQPAAQGK
jgi:Skp family chaperone for outer membrane proteins